MGLTASDVIMENMAVDIAFQVGLLDFCVFVDFFFYNFGNKPATLTSKIPLNKPHTVYTTSIISASATIGPNRRLPRAQGKGGTKMTEERCKTHQK